MKKQSVLVIDDSQDTLVLQRILLESEGYEVHTVESGAEGLAILSEISEPNLILLDMQMEDMSGVEFLIKLEEKKPEIIKDVPIVFFTAMNSVPTSKAAGFIRKPVLDMPSFFKSVHRFIEMGHSRSFKH
jgi:CheY-like chemotaxis protein